MPFGNGTGPAGLGPMTGRKAGFCAGYSVPGNMNPVHGRGFGLGRGLRFGYGGGGGFGRGRGRGWRSGYGYTPYPLANVSYPAVIPNIQPDPEDEKSFLKAQAKYFQDQLGAINERISELEKSAAEKKV